MKKKFYQRLWILRNLKKAMLPAADMLSLYNSLIRPVLEFAAPAFHSLLTVAQSGELEQLQARAFKLIYGWKTSYRAALETSGAPRLEHCRKQLVDNFALKCVKSSRFTGWFLENSEIPYRTRRREKYFVPPTRTNRCQKNPITYMRRRLNSISNNNEQRNRATGAVQN